MSSVIFPGTPLSKSWSVRKRRMPPSLSPSGSQGSVRLATIGAGRASRIPIRPAVGKRCRARARHHVPPSMVRRSGQHSNQPRFPHRDEQRQRPLQGRTPLPSLGQPRHPGPTLVPAFLQGEGGDSLIFSPRSLRVIFTRRHNLSHYEGMPMTSLNISLPMRSKGLR